MRFDVKIALVAVLVWACAAAGWAQYSERTYDPDPNYGGKVKVFYEGWGYGPPAGQYSTDPSSLPYKVESFLGGTVYGNGWTSIGVNDSAWVCSGLNDQTNPKPKPPYYHLAGTEGYIHEGNDWTNTTEDGGSRPFGDPGYFTGTYLQGPQANYNQAVWLDLNGDAYEVGPRQQILLKHDFPTLDDPKKFRASVDYFLPKNAIYDMGIGLRIYFEKVGGGEATVDFALHYYNGDDTKFAWRIQGIAEHPEWETWTDTSAPFVYISFDKPQWKHIGIDCGQIVPNSLTFLARGPKDFTLGKREYEPDSGNMIAASVPNFADYVVRATALAVGQVDEAPTYTSDIGEKHLWLDNIWISQGINEPITTIEEAKTAGAARPVRLTGKVVTAAFYEDNPEGTPRPACFAIEEPDRHIGIRVISSTAVSANDLVDISGTVALIGGERVIVGGLVTVVGTGSAPAPVAMTNLASGGGVFGAQPAVVNDGFAVPPEMATGLSNVGILMRLVGQVTYCYLTGDYTGYVYIDDGSGISDGSGFTGIRCRPGADPDNYNYPKPLPFEYDYVAITGVMGVTEVYAKNARFFWTVDWRSLW